MKKLYLTVNEFAELHHVNKRTLHYYDKEGVFSPMMVGDNHYRYYTYQQNGQFEIILALRELGMTIEEIKEYQKNRDPEKLAAVMKEKAEQLEEKIWMLQNIHSLLVDKRNNLLLSMSDEIDDIRVVDMEGDILMLTDIRRIYEGEDMHGEIVDALSGYLKDGTKTFRPFNTAYGTVLDLENIEKGDYLHHHYLFVKIRGIGLKEGLTERKGGTYLRGFAKGTPDNIPETYERMKEYAKEHGITLTGPSYEEGMNEFGIKGHDDLKNYVTRIIIPCNVSK